MNIAASSAHPTLTSNGEPVARSVQPVALEELIEATDYACKLLAGSQHELFGFVL